MVRAEVRRWQPDKALFLLTVALVVAGLAMVFSASSATTLDQGLSPFYFLIKQIVAAVIGFALMRVMLTFDYKILTQPRIYMTVLLISVSLLVLVLFMPAVNRTNRWFTLPFVSFQPSELATVALVIALAAIAARWRGMLTSWGFLFLTLAVFVTPIVFLIGIQPDLGTAAAVAVVSLAVLFAGGIGMRKLIVLFVIAGIGVGLYIGISPYRIPGDPVGDRARLGRPCGCRLHGKPPETLLLAGVALGFHLLGDRRRVGTARIADDPRSIPRAVLAGPADCFHRTRSLRFSARGGDHDDGGRAGPDEY